MMSYDVIVIGAGVVGSAVARELSRYQLKTAVLEKELDVACGNSSRNTGMLHAGFTYKPGSLKAECAVEGNQEFDQVAKELGGHPSGHDHGRSSGDGTGGGRKDRNSGGR